MDEEKSSEKGSLPSMTSQNDPNQCGGNSNDSDLQSTDISGHSSFGSNGVIDTERALTGHTPESDGDDRSKFTVYGPKTVGEVVKELQGDNTEIFQFTFASETVPRSKFEKKEISDMKFVKLVNQTVRGMPKSQRHSAAQALLRHQYPNITLESQEESNTHIYFSYYGKKTFRCANTSDIVDEEEGTYYGTYQRPIFQNDDLIDFKQEKVQVWQPKMKMKNNRKKKKRAMTSSLLKSFPLFKIDEYGE